MEPTTASTKSVRFGVFEADFVARELRKRGRGVSLQDQPFQVLALLLRHPGEIVTREELQEALWPAGTFVEFEHGVNTAIKKIRQALGDSADNPRFIETLPRKGYRFIAPVEAPIVPSSAAAARRGRPLWRLVSGDLVLVAAAVLVLAAVGLWLVRSGAEKPEAPLTAVPLTTYPGTEDSPSFSPDGTQVAFQWCPEGPDKNCDIYVKQIGVEPPSRLTDTPSTEYSPAWSPDGRTIAFLRVLSRTSASVALVLIPQRGGRERVVTESDFAGTRNELPGPYLAWTPDSKWLACWLPSGQKEWTVNLISVETGEKRRLTNPPPGASDMTPAFSPDGRTLAFTRLSEARSDLCLLRLAQGYTPQGEPERIQLDTPYNFVGAWTPDGRDILFANGDGGLWRLAASNPAMPRRLAFAPDNAISPAISRQGSRLAYSVETFDTNIWRVDLREPGGKPGVPVRFISSTRQDGEPAYSPDGTRIAFASGRSGFAEIWACDADGSNPVQLTSFGRPLVSQPKWSPDSQRIAFRVQSRGNSDLYVINGNGGAPRRLTTDPASDQWPSWSRDGQSLYFNSERSGKDEIWKMPAGGGKPVQVTRDPGADLPHESPDGKFVYYSKGYPFPQSVWRVPAEGGEGTKVIDAVHPSALWTVGKDGVYFFTVPDKQGHSDLSLHEFATGKTRKILTIERPVSYLLAVSPDGRTILYPQIDEAGSDLMLVENFR